jgi:hypothetical protein
MRGRRPLPTAIKELTGNPGKRPLNLDEPHPPKIIPKCPKHLDENARKKWRRISLELHRLGKHQSDQRPRRRGAKNDAPSAPPAEDSSTKTTPKISRKIAIMVAAPCGVLM